MNKRMVRREFIKLLGVSSVLTQIPAFARASKPPIGRVVIIGGGYAGATAAKYIRLWSLGNIETVVIEQNNQFISCPLSNLVIGGSKQINDLTFSYDLLKKNHGIKWVHDTVTAIDTHKKSISMKRGEISYDRLIIAPGVDFDYSAIPNIAQAQEIVPHAWKAGSQTVNLRKQLETMPDGGVFVICIPQTPYRCPPGPYERACQVANYFKEHKPKSKVIILDANGDIVAKKGLFAKAFNGPYAGIIDYRPNNPIISIDVATKTVKADFDTVKADVLNVIPPQLAGKPTQMAQLNNVDNRWCEVDFLTYESKVSPYVHVIGDSVSAGLPKSAHMATSQAKVCASAIVELMSGNPPDPTPVFANTCYSFVDNTQAIHVANVYRYDPTKKVMVSAEGGGVSIQASEKEGEYARAWAYNIWSDTLT
jgi:sulfide dehydrogenase [flavocytochrome c] flavoprotein chain